MKNNSVLLPESYFRTIKNYDNGCICMSYMHNKREHYIAWAPYGSNMRDTEIGINSNVAKAIGLKEGAIVTCTVIGDVPVVDSVSVTANSQKDWEMLEVSSYRIQSTLLDQTRVITSGQSLVIWINPAMFLVVNVERLKPNAPYGKLANYTEVFVAPFTNLGYKLDDVKPIITDEIIRRTKPPQTNGFNHHRYSLQIPERRSPSPEPVPIPAVIPPPKKYTGRDLDNLAKDLQRHDPRFYEFRVISSKWEDSQMCDLFLTRHNLPECLDINQVFKMKTVENKEFFVNLKILGDKECFPHNIYPTIEMNDILMHRLGVHALERITIKPIITHLNAIDRIELAPSKAVDLSRARDIEQYFKQHVIDTASMYPVLLNQGQIFKLRKDIFVTVTIFPEVLKHGTIDASILRMCKVTCREQPKEIAKIDDKPVVAVAQHMQNGLKPSPSCVNLSGSISGHVYVALRKFEAIIEDAVERMKVNLCLDERGSILKMGNIIISGKSKSGKSMICKNILDKLAQKPFYCHSDVFYCSKNKGRKPESILRDLRTMFNTCITCAPAILILDSLDILSQNVAEHTADGEYYNRVSDVIQHLILEYTRDNPIAVIATVANKSNLNKRIYTSRGRHLFHFMGTIPDLEKVDREKIICDLCQKLKTSNINYKKFANLTEGYNVGDLVEFVERAIFYAHRLDSKKPTLTNDSLNESLKKTNAYCLQGIELNSQDEVKDTSDSEDDDDDDDDEPPEGECDKNKHLAGLESVVTVLEEVLIWPAKYPTIFDGSPLRNQAGVLLFGPPGTGKTYLVSKLAKLWHLRLISVKGPELLAKYIGQSEENVRNLFDRAKSARPCVLFFDEFDSLAPKRGHDSTGVTDRVVNQLLTELDGVEGLQGVIVIAATSRPELLDGALLRSGRIDRLVECPLPDRNARLAIFKTLSKTLNLDKLVDLSIFADKTDNYTGADIQSILTSANMTAVKECLNKDSENVPDKIFITQDHLMDAFINTRPSLSGIDIEKYRRMYARFTNKEKPSRDFVAKRATLA